VDIRDKQFFIDRSKCTEKQGWIRYFPDISVFVWETSKKRDLPASFCLMCTGTHSDKKLLHNYLWNVIRFFPDLVLI
jgi:hypothetical protein